MRNLYLHWNRWMMKAPLLVNFPPFLRPNHPRRVSQFHLSKSAMTVCGCFCEIPRRNSFFFFFRKPIVAMSVRWIIFLFFSCVYREKTFKRKLSIWVNERCAKKNRLEQLTNKFAKWASCLLFFSPFLGSGYNELFGVVCASVCVWLCKTVSFYVSLSITKCS